MARPAAGEERTVPTQGIVSVEIRSRSGDIRVYKGDDPAHISTWGDQVKVEVQGTQLLVSSHADLRLEAPRGPRAPLRSPCGPAMPGSRRRRSASG
ncbi:MAG: hypothetical protein H6730_14450 [Deltaproteobacteria bacterium]|nr:hypothetical protein [Deltaproteobacteria bacterium]